MSLLDRILRRKEEDRAGRRRDRDVQSHDGVTPVASDLAKVASPPASTSGTPTSRVLPGVLLGAHISEKTARLGAIRQYAFIVRRNASKPEVRRAVEARYGVKVESVNILNTSAKLRRRGRQVGYRPGFRKAIVTTRGSERIEIE